MIGEIRQNFTEASASVGLILATALLLITCFRHYDILDKTSSRMITAIAFSRPNGAGSSASFT